jgi:hypothetical protein
MGKYDIIYLKLRLQLYLLNEQYEKAEVIKKWITDLGGDPSLDDEQLKKILRDNL